MQWIRVLRAFPLSLVAALTGCPYEPPSGGAAGQGADVDGAEQDGRVFRTAIIDTPDGPREVEYEVVRGMAVVEGDMIMGTEEEFLSGEKGIGVRSRDRKWPRRTVPFVIDPNFSTAMATRINQAMVHWEDNTDIDFVARTNQPDYVQILSSDTCRSDIGKNTNGTPNVLQLSTGQVPSSIVGIATVWNGLQTYAWYTDGSVSAGLPGDLDWSVPQFRYALPAGKAPSDIVAMDIDSTGRVYTWYRDQNYSIGRYDNLTHHQGLTRFDLPANTTTGMIVGMHFGAANVLNTYFSHGFRSTGVPNHLGTNLTAYSAKQNVAFDQIVETARDRDGVVTAWYLTPVPQGALRTYGLEANLAQYHPDAFYTTPPDCGLGTVIHELGHTIGLGHEVARCDRDTFVQVNYDNIVGADAGSHPEFDIHCEERDLSTYDFKSIMHYRERDFSKNGEKTIERRDHLALDPNQSALSAGDIRSVAELYGYSPAKWKSAASIVGIGINSVDAVITWYNDYTVTSGVTWDQDEYQPTPSTFTTPPGKTVSDIVAMDISSIDRVYTWYSDGTVSEGSYTDLDSIQPPRSVTFPGGYTASQIVGVAIIANDRYVYYFSNGKRSIGLPRNPTYYIPLADYSVAPGRSFTSIRDTACDSENDVYVWHSDYSLSAGSNTDLDSLMEAW